MPRVRIRGTDKSLDIPLGQDLLEACQVAGVPISTSCGGKAVCGLCRLTIVSGKENLSPLLPGEIVHLGNVAKIVGLRLACQTTFVQDGDVEVDIPEVEDIAARKREKADRYRREMREARERRSNPGGPPGGQPSGPGKPRND